MQYSKLLMLVAFLFCTELSAQKYITALGLQGGNGEIGVTFQQRVFGTSTVEGLLTFSTNHITMNALYEYHKPILTKGLNYYVGGGPHFGQLKDEGPFVGATGIVGLEFKFPVLPIVFGASLRPEFHLNHPNNFELKSGIAVRYVLRTQREQNKSRKQKSKKGQYKSGKLKYKKKK